MRKIIFLLNPQTLYFKKTFNRATVENFFKAYDDIDISFYRIKARGEITEILTSEISKGVDTVVVVGGNGTLLETVQSLAYSNVKLGLITTGAGAAFSKYSDYPEVLEECLEAVANNKAKNIDLGKVTDEKRSMYFLNYFCVGFTGGVVHKNFPDNQINRIYHYIFAAIKELIFFKPIKANFIINSKNHEAYYHEIFFGNVASYGGVTESNYLSELTDGKLDIFAYRDLKKRKIFKYLIQIFLDVEDKFHENAELFKITQCNVELEENTFVQVDWEKQFFSGNISIQCCPKSLKVLVPNEFEFV